VPRKRGRGHSSGPMKGVREPVVDEKMAVCAQGKSSMTDMNGCRRCFMGEGGGERVSNLSQGRREGGKKIEKILRKT